MKKSSFLIITVSFLMAASCWITETLGRLNFLSSSINEQWGKVEVAYSQELSLVKQLHPQSENPNDLVIASYQQKIPDSYLTYLQKLKTSPERLIMGISSDSANDEKNLPHLDRELDHYHQQISEYNAYIDKPLVTAVGMLQGQHSINN